AWVSGVGLGSALLNLKLPTPRLHLLAPRRGFWMLRHGSGRLYFELQVAWPRLGVGLEYPGCA
ncbi:hypothetical protein PIB30_069699, partial [Stylosanthes scabra]|nr:hypothetical protein [Stylosanthes scabra]